MSLRFHGICVVVAILCVVAVTVWWTAPPGRVDNPDSDVDRLPPPAPSRFANSRSEIDWVGSAACGDCHADEHASYLATAHSRALAEVDPDSEPPNGRVDHFPSGRSYEIHRRDGELRHRESLRPGGGGELTLADHAVDYVIGSGRFSRSYLVVTDGFFVQSPVTWYAEREAWGMSPGYDRNNSGFERPTEVRCIECHAGRVTPIDNSLHRLRIHEAVIGCERCHGPGELHRKKWLSSLAAGRDGHEDETIVHPGRLARQRQEAICAQCHLHGDASVAIRGRSMSDFRPGQRLCDFRVSFAVEDADKSMEVVGHVEQMHLSACYRESDTLTCTTCHDPHRKPEAEHATTWYRARCLGCHGENACGLERTVRLERRADDDCVACHMPRVPTEIPHFAFTHHRIGLHAAPKETVLDHVAEQPGELIPLSDVSHLPAVEIDRLQGLGYLQLLASPTHGRHGRVYHRRALDLLTAVRASGVRDPDLDAALARLHWQTDPERAVQFAEDVLSGKDPPPDAYATALFVHGTASLELGETEAAADSLERLVEIRRYGFAWFRLSQCRERLGDPAGALSAAEEAARITPQAVELHRRLAELYRRTGRASEAAASLRRASRLEQVSSSPPRSN